MSVNPKERLTLLQIKSQPWFKGKVATKSQVLILNSSVSDNVDSETDCGSD